MWPYRPMTTVVLLAPMVFTFALALDVYMPVLPELKTLLNTSEGMLQLTLSLFFFITGVGQLFVGPISDQYGRQKVLLCSAVIFLVASLLCTTVNHIGALILYRIIQAVGACGLSVVSFAIVRDAFSGHESTKIYSFLNSTISISPILGPIIGVVLTTWFSWHSIFFFLTGLGGLTTLISLFLIKESLPLTKRLPMDLGIFQRYGIVMRSLTFWTYVMPAVAGISGFFTLFSMTPYVIQALGQPKSQIAVCFGLAGGAFLVGSIINGLIVKQLGNFMTALIGVALMMSSGGILLGIYLIWGMHLWGFFIPSTLATCGCAFAVGSGAGGAMEPFGHITGAAAAMFGATQIGLSSMIGTLAAALLPLDSALPLAFVLLMTTVISSVLLFLWRLAEKK